MPSVTEVITVPDTNVIETTLSEVAFTVDGVYINWYAILNSTPTGSDLVRHGALELVRTLTDGSVPVSFDVIQWYGWGIYRAFTYTGLANTKFKVRLWPDANAVGKSVTFSGVWA